MEHLHLNVSAVFLESIPPQSKPKVLKHVSHALLDFIRMRQESLPALNASLGPILTSKHPQLARTAVLDSFQMCQALNQICHARHAMLDTMQAHKKAAHTV
jgi:hypothetical protein